MSLNRLAGGTMLAGAILAGAGYVWATAADHDHAATPAIVDSAGYLGSYLLIFAGSALVLFTLPAVIARQYARSRKLTLIGGVGLALVTLIQGVANTFGNVTLFPMLVDNPATIDAANGNPPAILGVFFVIGLAASVVGIIVLAIAILKARVFPRWIGVLMLVGAVAGPISGAGPSALENLAAIIGMVAVGGLGASLLRTSDVAAVPAPAAVQAPAAV